MVCFVIICQFRNKINAFYLVSKRIISIFIYFYLLTVKIRSNLLKIKWLLFNAQQLFNHYIN
jgi:hypothetical protein